MVTNGEQHRHFILLGPHLAVESRREPPWENLVREPMYPSFRRENHVIEIRSWAGSIAEGKPGGNIPRLEDLGEPQLGERQPRA